MSDNPHRSTVAELVSRCALIANDVAVAKPLATSSDRSQVNAYFGVSSERDSFTGNIALLPDEMATAFLQLAGGHVYSISQLVQAEVGPPSVLALARVAVEAMASAYWLSSPGTAVERTSRVIWINYLRLKSLSEAGVPEAQVSEWQMQFKELIDSSGLAGQEPKRRDIRTNLLGEGEDWKYYKYLHSYVHSDPSMAAADFLAYSLKPGLMECKEFEGAFYSGRILARVAASVARLRVVDDELMDELENLVVLLG